VSLTTVDFRRLHLEPGQRLLDLGCGEGRHAITARLEAPVHVVGLDPSAGDLATARGRAAQFEASVTGGTLAWVRSNGEKLPFADATFDRVLCAEVLEHVPDPGHLLGEIRRVLKPGGVLAVSVPRFVPERICWLLSHEYHAVEGGHVRIFRSRELREAVEAHGLRRYHRHWAHGLHSPYWWLRCLFWSQGPEVWLVRQYHRLLVWDLMQRPWPTRWLGRALDPLIGKSVVMYFTLDAPRGPGQRAASPLLPEERAA
jgi:SAM-dependent methyltransferase